MPRMNGAWRFLSSPTTPGWGTYFRSTRRGGGSSATGYLKSVAEMAWCLASYCRSNKSTVVGAAGFEVLCYNEVEINE